MIKNGKGTSPAISMVIITAVTVMLVLVAGSYAYQVLERQRGAAEFDAVKKSFLAFDDAVRDVAWDRSSSRSARFTVNYGRLELIPNASLLTVNVIEYPDAIYSTFMGQVRYSISTDFITFGYGYESYILGDKNIVVSSGTESFGQALIKQESSWVKILLNYRVRVMGVSSVKVNGVNVNYVDILIIKINVIKRWIYIGDFDLTARNVGITTISSRPYDFKGGSCTVSASLDGSSSSVTINLSNEGKVVFNFIIADVRITT